jgi:hypothetical protein
MEIVRLYVTDLEPFFDDCEATIRAFERRNIEIEIIEVANEDLQKLSAEGFSELPVVKPPERQGKGWEGHRPDLIAAYEPLWIH